MAQCHDDHGFLRVFAEQVNPQTIKVHLNTDYFNQNTLDNQFDINKLSANIMQGELGINGTQ